MLLTHVVIMPLNTDDRATSATVCTALYKLDGNAAQCENVHFAHKLRRAFLNEIFRTMASACHDTYVHVPLWAHVVWPRNFCQNNISYHRLAS